MPTLPLTHTDAQVGALLYFAEHLDMDASTDLQAVAARDL